MASGQHQPTVPRWKPSPPRPQGREADDVDQPPQFDAVSDMSASVRSTDGFPFGSGRSLSRRRRSCRRGSRRWRSARRRTAAAAASPASRRCAGRTRASSSRGRTCGCPPPAGRAAVSPSSAASTATRAPARCSPSWGPPAAASPHFLMRWQVTCTRTSINLPIPTNTIPVAANSDRSSFFFFWIEKEWSIELRASWDELWHRLTELHVFWVHVRTGRLGSSVSQKGDILINGRRQALAFGTSVSQREMDSSSSRMYRINCCMHDE